MRCPVNGLPLGINNIFRPRLLFFPPFFVVLLALFVCPVRVWLKYLGPKQRLKPQATVINSESQKLNPKRPTKMGSFWQVTERQTETIFSIPNRDSIAAHLEHHYGTLGEFECS